MQGGGLRHPRPLELNVMFLDVGEWWHANVLFAIVFLVAGAGVVAIGWYVLKGDRANRQLIDNVDADVSAEDGHSH